MIIVVVVVVVWVFSSAIQFRLDEDTKKFLAEYIALDAEHFRLSCGKVFK